MNLTDALTSAAQGAAAGAVAGPVGAAVGGLGGLVVDIAPEVGRWLFGASAGRTAGLVAQAVEAATGTADAEAAQAVLAQDPAAVSQLRVQLATIAAQQQAEADRAAEQRVIAFPVLGDGHGLAERHALRVQAREHVALGRDIDPSKHGILPSVGLRASEPAPMPALVQARTPARQTPPHTVRAKNAGRGRQSHCRGQCLHHDAATLSQRPPHHTSRDVRR